MERTVATPSQRCQTIAGFRTEMVGQTVLLVPVKEDDISIHLGRPDITLGKRLKRQRVVGRGVPCHPGIELVRQALAELGVHGGRMPRLRVSCRATWWARR